MKDIIQIAAFMKRKVKALRYMQRHHLLGWLNWHAHNKSLAYVEDNGKVIAAGVARQITPLIQDLMQDQTEIVRRMAHYMNDDDGEIVYAEQAASDSKAGLAGILLAMQKRFPKAKQFVFRNKQRGSMKRTYDMNRFVDKAVQLGRFV